MQYSVVKHCTSATHLYVMKVTNIPLLHQKSSGLSCLPGISSMSCWESRGSHSPQSNQQSHSRLLHNNSQSQSAQSAFVTTLPHTLHTPHLAGKLLVLVTYPSNGHTVSVEQWASPVKPCSLIHGTCRHVARTVWKLQHNTTIHTNKRHTLCITLQCLLQERHT